MFNLEFCATHWFTGKRTIMASLKYSHERQIAVLADDATIVGVVRPYVLVAGSVEALRSRPFSS